MRPLLERQMSGTSWDSQACLDVLDRQHVAIAHHEIDVVERDALGAQAIVDHFLVEAGRRAFARVMRSLAMAKAISPSRNRQALTSWS